MGIHASNQLKNRMGGIDPELQSAIGDDLVGALDRRNGA